MIIYHRKLDLKIFILEITNNKGLGTMYYNSFTLYTTQCINIVFDSINSYSVRKTFLWQKVALNVKLELFLLKHNKGLIYKA